MTHRTEDDHGHDHAEAQLAAFRARLADAHGPRYWRSLEELAGTEEFQEFLHREFPANASEWTDPASRRQFLRLMGASLALAGVSGCAFQPPESIVPYVVAPESVVPGRPLFYATAMTLGGYATGLLVETHMGRPTKVEGNPDHPASLGATDAFAQASILDLYDPDRSQVVTRNGRVSTWDDFLSAVAQVRQSSLAAKGAGLRILTETVTSPTLAHQFHRLLEEMPEARWHQYEPAGRDAARAGAKRAFGRDVEARYHVDRADVVLAIDSDFLACGPAQLPQARAFARRRLGAGAGGPGMNRLYAIEGTTSLTGAMADHRFRVRPRDIPAVAHAIARELGIAGVAPAEGGGLSPRWVAPLVKDLRAHQGSSLVLVGDGQPAEIHALAHAMNHALGNAGKTVEYLDPIEARPVDQMGSLRELVRDMHAGAVKALVILGGNPAYTAPADLDFVGGLARVAREGLTIRLGLYEDETSSRCQWHVPEAHYLEAWGDARAFDGTATIQQPMIAPLHGGKTATEVLAPLLGQASPSALEILRDDWKRRKLGGDDFEAAWRKALHEGFVPMTAASAREATLASGTTFPRLAPATSGVGELDLVFRPDPTLWDGRFANNGWLQELPKPLTKLTWDNAALISPATAGRLELESEDVIELGYRGRVLTLPVWVTPGHADDAVTVHLGHGRTRAGRVGDGTGVNAYALRTSDAPWGGPGLTVRKTGERRRLANTQHHYNMEGREIVRVGTLDQYRQQPDFAREPDAHITRELTLYEDSEPRLRRENGEGNSWGMAIDLNVCTGCSACVVACQAENNIPVVGREQVLRGREMHWLRIDRYYEGEAADDPHTYFQPMLCQHCEKAPCELVCPVAATSHSAEGLNEMTYNRCVGTRYCGNNCPYKVRRFNFLQYSDEHTPTLKLMRNPDVTVRSRGVMEKCTFCVQRINAARIAAEQAGATRVAGNAVVTACQAACPTRAIVFGNLNDPAADVVRLKANTRNYAVLAELNTRPRTTYLAKLTNPNPEIAAE
jgi:molybdopterin-containing oxidoreductase family iron-sulfur binding subunit